jgi:hypothetical protein
MGFKHALTSAYKRAFGRAFKRKSSKPIIAGIALALVGLTTAVAFALAIDPGANSKIDYAMNFNGSTTYLRSENQVVPANSDFTMEAYFKETVGNANSAFLMSAGSQGAADGTIGLFLSGAANQRCVAIAMPNGVGDCSFFSTAFVPQGDWQHVALTYQNSTQTYTLFLNGNQIGQRDYSTTPAIRAGFSIGRNGVGTSGYIGENYFSGQIDEVKVFNSVRTQTQIAADTNTYLASSTTGLTAEYDFNEGASGSGSVYDRTTNNNDLTIYGAATFSDIANYSVPDRTTDRIVFKRSYLNVFGGWFPPAGVTTVSGLAISAGGGGGGGSAYETLNGGGGGGGGSGASTTISSVTLSSASAVPIKVGLGGPGGIWGTTLPGDTSLSIGTNGFSGQATTFNASTVAGGAFGYAGGYASGTSTNTAGLGGKGGNNGGGYTGSTITTLNDGGGGAGGDVNTVGFNTRAGNGGKSITTIGGSLQVQLGGSGGYGAATSASATFGAPGAAATGSGGGGGGGIKSSSYAAAYPGGFGSAGLITMTYAPTANTQDNDYLYTFNGSSQYAESMPSTSSFDVTGDLTIEGWVKPATTCASAYCTIMGRDNDYLVGTSNGTYRWKIATSTGASSWYDTGVPLVVGQWQHVALVRSGASVLFYLNGQLASTQTNGDADASGSTISMTATSQVGPGWFELAARGIDHQDMFNGGIDDVRVWNIARTAVQLGDASTGDFNRPLNATELASANLIAYWDMNDTIQTTQMFINRKTGSLSLTDLAAVGSPTWVVNGASSLITNQYLNLNSANNQTLYSGDSSTFELTGSNFTISAWWKISACTAPNYLVTKANSYSIATDTNCKINFELDPGNEGDAQTWVWMNSNYVMSTATWHYVSLAKVGNTAYLYVDGVLAATINDGATVPTFNSTGNVTAVVPSALGNRNTYFGIGSVGVGTTRTGMTSQNIDDVRIWSTDRRTTQATDMKGLVPHTSPGLRVMYNFDTIAGNYNSIPNSASSASFDSVLTNSGSSLNTSYASATPPSGQTYKYQQFIQRSIIQSSTVSGVIPINASGVEYWMAGGGGGGGTGGNSGYSGAGGGAGGLVEGTAIGLPSNATLTTQKIGVGGRYAVNNGDSVTQTANNGTLTLFSTTGYSLTASGGGAGGSGTTNPASAPQGAAGGSGGGSGQTGGAGGAANQGYAGGAGSSAAAGGGGGARSAGADAANGAGGAGGAGYLLPSLTPVWVQGGGTGFGSTSAVNSNSALGATAVGADASAASGSGGGGAGFVTAGSGTVRGGLGASGFILNNYVLSQPVVDQGSNVLLSGGSPAVPLTVSLRTWDGGLLNVTDSLTISTGTSGCSIPSGSSATAVAGQATFGLLAVKRATAGTCTLTITDSANAMTTTFDVTVKTAPASINVTNTTTTGTCTFSSGFFTCPDTTAATLNVTDLNAALDSNALVQLVTASGAITTDPAVTITGSGALRMSAYTTATLKSNVNLTGSGMDLTVRALGVIDTNSSATSGSPTTIQTNGGSIYLLGPGTSSGGIYIRGYNLLKTNGGNLMISGGANYLTGYSGDSGNNGIYFYANASAETGAGSLTLRGSLPSSGGNQAGVYLASGSVVKSSSGAITIIGNTLNIGVNNYRQGVRFDGNSILSDSGNITINGDSSNDSNSWKTGIQSSGLTLTTNSGNVSLTGNASTAYPSFSGLNFQTSRSTINSGTGTLTLTDNMVAGGAGSSSFDYLTIQGSGAEQITANYPVFYTTSGFQAQGTGDLTIKSTAGGFYAGINFTSQTSFGTGYQNITITDLNTATSNAYQLIIATKLQAANTVTLKAGQVSGSAGVVATHLASQTYYSLNPNNRITGSSDVVDAAFNSGTATPNGTVGITDINTFTPADVNGVTAQWAIPYKAVAGTGTAWVNNVNTCVNGNIGTLIAKLQDKWNLDIPANATQATTYSLTASSSSGTSVLSSAATTPVAAVNNIFTLSNIGYVSGIASGNVIKFTPSPTLPGTTALYTYQASGLYISVAASCAFAKVVLTAGSTSAISGQTWAVQPTLQGQDAYGNSASLSSGSYPTSVSLTSGPSGGAVAGTFTLSNGNTTGSGFKITGPTGTYVVTYTINGFSTTHTLAVTGWSVDYGGTSLPMIVGTYPATFTGNGTGAVTYSTSTGAICSVNASSGAMTPLGVGTCTITANQATDGTAPAGSASVSITITKGTQAAVTLTSSPTSLVYGSSVTLSGAGGNGTGGFSYQKVSGNCSISGASLQANTANAGDICVVTATKVSDANWNSGVSANYSFTVAQAAQAAVTVPAGQSVGYNNPTDLTQAPYTPSGGSGTGAWSFSTSSSNCSISGNLLTSTTSIGGTCVVAVKRLAQGNYADSTPVNMTLTTAKGSQTISYNTISSSVRVGDTETLSATSTSGLAVSYAVASGSSSYCSLQGATVTFNAPGSCVINVNQSGDANYNAATLTPITYTVAKGLQTISFDAIADDVVRTTTLSLGATSSSTLAVTYAVAAGTTNSACTVTSTGVVTLSAVGVCSITASQAGNANYEAATDVTQTFNVAKGTQSSLTITSASNPQFGQTVALTATGGNGSASYSFAVVSGPCSIASGTTSLILGDAGTTCVISVDRAGDANWNAATTATQTVTTAKAAQATLNITNQNAVVYGNQVALTYGGGSGNGAITWSVTSPCSISGTTLSVGNAGVGCTLSLSKDGDDNYLPATATLSISVTRASQAPVTITSGDHYTYRQSLTLSATGGSGSGAITFAATGDCSVSGGNLLSGGGAGSSCSVIATRAQSTNYNAESSAAMTITIDKANQTISPVTVLGAPRALGTVNLIANADSNLNVDLTIDSGSTAVCTISGRIVSFLKAGDCVVNADQAGDTNFNAATQLQTTLTAAHASQTINLTNPGLKRYLDPNFYITGSTSSSLGITYSLGAGTTGYGQSSQVCAVSQQGEVQIGEVGTCQILANQAGDDVYDPATQVSLNITIAKALQTTLSLSSADTYVYGTTLQLMATGGDGNGAVTFVGGPSQQCSIDPATSIISGGDAGSGCNVRIVKAGDDHFEATQTGLLPITITQAAQSVNITSTPVSPTALGTYTLTASSDSGDTITYSVPWTTTVCSVSGDVVTFLTQGTCIVQADQVGNTNYLPAQYDQQGIGVAYATQTLNWTTPTGVTFGDLPFQLQASASSGLNLVYLYTPGGACSISNVGEVTIVGAGACDIHIGQPGNATYADSGVQHISFNVAKAQQASLTESSITSTPYGDNVYLHALGGSGTGSVSYEARGTCTINQNLMIPGDAGTLCEVRAVQDADNDYEIAYSPWVTIEITRAFQQTLLISSSGTVTYGSTISLTTVGGTGPNPTTFVTTGTCSVSGSTLTPGDAGSTCTVKAVNAISTNYYAAESPTQTITVAKANQSINFTSSASQAVALGSYHVTASADSGDSVTFSISMGSSTVCSISGSTVSFLTSGTCLINADQAGNTNYNQAFTVFQTVSVAHAPQTITFSPAGVKHYGDSSFSASASSTSGLTILYGLGAGTTNGSCLVASDGTVTIMDVGTCEVTADQIGDSTYAAAARATQSITIATGTQQALSISSANYVTYGQTQTLTTSGGSGQGSVSFDASGDCSESSGVLTVGAVGSNCQVRATKAADSQYLAITSPWLTVSVIKAHQATLTISSANSVAYGSTLALAVSGGSGSGTVTYATTGTCSVTNGILSVGVVGSSCSVIATKAESANYLVASSQPQTVAVVKAANLIHLNPLSTPVAALDTYSVDVSADSGDPVVVAIDASTSSVCTAAAGIVTFVTSGSCVINLNEDGNSNFNAATQVQETVSVGLAMQAIAFNAAGVKHYGDPTFQASAYSNSNLPITYSIGPGTTNNACSVASDGTVTILDVGDCEVSADQAGNNVYSAAGTAGQMIPILKGTQSTLTMSSSSSVAYGTAFTLATSGGSGSGAVTFATTGQCTQSSGILTVGTVGSLCRVRATKAADSRYNAITSVYQTITVIRGPQAALTISSASNVAYDSSITLTTSGGSGNGAVTYMSGGNCYVSYGVLYPGAAGVPCVVRAHKDGDSNFTSIDSADFTVTVDKADQTISVLGFAVNPVAHDYYSPFVTASSNLNVDVSVDPSSSSVCSYGHGGIYFDTAGDCVINYNQAGDSNYNAAPQLQETVTVAKLTQTISTNQIGLKHYGDSAFQIVSSSDSGLPLTFTQDANTTNNSCTVSSTGYVTILAPGTCAWIASQAGDASYLSTTTNVLWFSIDRAQQSATTLVLSSTSAPAGGTITMSVTGGSGSGSIRYVVSGTCTVSGNTLTVGNAGSQCSVYGIKEYDDYYAAEATAQQAITVTRAPQATLTIDSTDTVVYGNTITLSTTGGSGSGSVTYATTGTCSVSNGILTVGNAGSSCAVTATKAQSANFNAANSAAQTITITRASQTISITSSPTLPTALDTYVVQAAATSGLSVDVSIDNSTSSACSVSGSTVTFLTSGSCVINANQSGGTNFTAASQVQQTVTVAKKAQASYLTIPSVSGNRQLGDADFSVSGSADSALAVTYGIGSSTTNNSCSINSSTGLVRILDVGECYITVNQGGNATWAVASAATGHFTIGKATQTPLVIASTATVVYGTVGNLYTTGGSVNGLVTYTTTGTCTVQTASLFVTDAGSACTVTAHLDGNDQYLPVDSATQVITVARADQQAFGLTNSGNFFHGQTITLQTGGGSGDGAVSYAISGDCTLVGDELTLGSASSVCLVTASKAQSLNYNAISDQTRTISIGKAGQTISITSTPSNPIALDTYTFAATASSGAPVTATIDNASSTVCSISNNVVTYLTSGSCVINANQGGNSNFNGATQVQQTITVAKKAQTISWPTISGQQFGVANFNAGASAGSSLSIAYSLGSSTTNSACSITSSGTVSILAAGECYLVADQAGDATWAAAAQVTIHFNVLRGNQATLSMASASSVDYGSTISLSTTGGSGTGSVSYSSTGTCTVSGSTLTVGNAGSACTVTATKAMDAQYLAQSTTAQTITINRAAQATLTVSSIAGLKHGQTMTLTASGGSGTGAITYTASGACTVSGATLTGGNAGTNCVVYATKAQSTNYLAVDSATVTEQVGKSAQTITVTSTPSNATALQTYTVSATASSGLAVSVAIASSTSTKCSVVGNVVTFNEINSCVVEVSQSGDSNFDPATTVTQTISVARAMDVITIPTLADRTIFSTSLTVSATSLSNAQLTYTSVPQAGNVFNCSITTSGTLTLITPGRCEIEVTHPDGSVYAAATNTARFMITRGEQATLSMTSASSVDYLGSIQLSASGGSGTGAISYTANGACTITNGVLTVADVGSSCSVTATRAGDTNYNAVTSATQTITVNQISQDAIIVVSAAHVRFGQQLPLVSAGGSGPGAETWSIDTTSVSNSAGCAINGTTLNLSVTTSGACDVVVTKAASRNYRSAVSPRFSVTVDKAFQSVAFTSTVPTAPVSGDTYTVAATSSAGLSVSYSVTSASAAYCSISGAVVSFTGTGDCEIVASQAGDGRYLAAPDVSQTIAVGSLNQVITASNVRNHTYGDPAFVVVGETTSSSPVTFSLGSNTTANSCSVTSSGVVTILAVGHCELVLSAAADAQYAAASDITKSFEIVADQASAPFVTSVSADNQSVTLSFLAPSYIGGSVIRAYGINAYLNGVLAASYSGCAANQTSCTMTGLTNGLAYTFRMVAVNAAGDGAESSATGSVTPATHAEAVRQLVAIGVNTALDVTWAAPASLGGGTFDSYRIYVRPRGGSYPSTPTEVIYSYSATSKQLTGLVNGTSYDVKVVTITTANTVQLVSNTAEVLQYPKTIPDAPQSVSLAPVGTAGLLVSWTAPISDGGDAIATYAAQVIGGTNCSVSATTNACEVSGLVDGATYRVSVVATNGAGTSPATEAQIVFHAATVASANQGNQSSQGNQGNGSGGGSSNPVIVSGGTTGDKVHGDVWISLDKIATARANGMVDGVSVSGSLGGKLIFKGKGLGLIYSAYIGNHIPVKILSANNEQVVVQVPASKLGGWQDMWFFTDSHAIRYMDAIQYVVAKAPIVKVLGGFKQNAKTLTQFQKGQLWKIVKQVGTFKQVDCKGSSAAAVATCKALKVKRPWVKIHVTKVKISHASVASKRVTLTFTK